MSAAHRPGIHRNAIIGAVVCSARCGRRWTQEELAKAADVSQPIISRIECGNVDVGLRLFQLVGEALWPGSRQRSTCGAAMFDIADLAARELVKCGVRVTLEPPTGLRIDPNSLADLIDSALKRYADAAPSPTPENGKPHDHP